MVRYSDWRTSVFIYVFSVPDLLNSDRFTGEGLAAAHFGPFLQPEEGLLHTLPDHARQRLELLHGVGSQLDNRGHFPFSCPGFLVYYRNVLTCVSIPSRAC